MYFSSLQVSLDSWQRGQRVEINYSKLVELCLRSLPLGSDTDQLTTRSTEQHLQSKNIVALIYFVLFFPPG